MNHKTKSRDIIVSRFEVYPDDPVWCIGADIPKTVGELIINTIDKTIAYKHISGWKPPLYVLLIVMGANRNWARLVSEFESLDGSQFIITTWNGYYTSEYFLASSNDQGLPMGEKKLVECDRFEGVDKLLISVNEYSLLIATATEAELWSRQRKLRWLLKECEFRYIK